MTNKELIETQHKFLTDKECMDKKNVEFAKNETNEIISKGLVSLLIGKIEIEILKDQLKKFKR
ncbi:14259_t:CDS:2 [Funneliformis geosporum]|nr:14259_t:CDS:2 [Funneliformis geosporum]